ncbi:MAG: HIRAN domain-containing protein [Flavobacteriaceae bacterium]
MILKKIYLSWRPGEGDGRFLVGVFSRENSSGDNIVFEYQQEEVLKAKEKGFYNYPEFPEINRTYKTNIKTALTLRLMPKTRADRNSYLSFWTANIDGLDWFDELGFTQGKLATDTFEFLAEFPKKFNGIGISFVSDVAALSHLKLDTDCINIGDKLRFETELDNQFDPNAIKLFKNELFIGYVKKGHNTFFQKIKNEDVNITVTNIEKNGKLKQVYFSVKVL